MTVCDRGTIWGWMVPLFLLAGPVACAEEAEDLTPSVCPVLIVENGSKTCGRRPCNETYGFLCYKKLMPRCDAENYKTPWSKSISGCGHTQFNQLVTPSNFDLCASYYQQRNGVFWVQGCHAIDTNSSKTPSAMTTTPSSTSVTESEPFTMTLTAGSGPTSVVTTPASGLLIISSSFVSKSSYSIPAEVLQSSMVSEYSATPNPVSSRVVSSTPFLSTTPEYPISSQLSSTSTSLTHSTKSSPSSPTVPTPSTRASSTTNNAGGRSNQSSGNETQMSKQTQTIIIVVGAIVGALLLVVIGLVAFCMRRLNSRLKETIRIESNQTRDGRTSGGRMTVFTDSGSYSNPDELANVEETVFGASTRLNTMVSPLHNGILAMSREPLQSRNNKNPSDLETRMQSRSHAHAGYNYYSPLPSVRGLQYGDDISPTGTNTGSNSHMERHVNGNSHGYGGYEHRQYNPVYFEGEHLAETRHASLSSQNDALDGMCAVIRKPTPLTEGPQGGSHRMSPLQTVSGRGRRFYRSGTTRSASLLSGTKGTAGSVLD